MPGLTEEALDSWRITYLPVGQALSGQVETVRAAYATGQSDLPGWTLLKDHHHRIVKMVRDEIVTDIERVNPGLPKPGLVARYRKKNADSAKVDPVLRHGPENVDAVLWSGPENSKEAFDFLGLAHPEQWSGFHTVDCQTYRGMTTFAMGEWIVKDGRGNPRPVKPDIFAATYEEISD